MGTDARPTVTQPQTTEPQQDTPRLTDDVIATISSETRAHRNTIMRRALGLPVKGSVRVVVDRALEARGFIKRGA